MTLNRRLKYLVWALLVTGFVTVAVRKGLEHKPPTLERVCDPKDEFILGEGIANPQDYFDPMQCVDKYDSAWDRFNFNKTTHCYPHGCLLKLNGSNAHLPR